MYQHPDFTNLSKIGTVVVRHDRYAIAYRSVLAEGDLYRIFLAADSDRHAAGLMGGYRRRNANSGLLQAELERHFASLPMLNAA